MSEQQEHAAMTPVRLRYLSEDCHDTIVEHFARSCPVALCQADSDVFFAVLCQIIDREIERVVLEAGGERAREVTTDRRAGT